MAQITNRGKYQWRARVRRKGYPDLSKTFNSKDEAKAWAEEIEREMRSSSYVSRVEAESTSLHEALERYEREISSSKKGHDREKLVLRLIKQTDLSLRPMASIRSADIASLRDRWSTTLKPATVLRRLALLSNVFTIARKEWGMESLQNPVEFVRKPKPNNARVRRLYAKPANASQLTTELVARGELERICEASGSRWLPYIVVIAVETAMRRSEIVAMTWGNLSLERRVAHLEDTKNGTARDVPLSTKAVETLQHLKDALEATPSLTSRVFPLSSDTVTQAFERAVARARKIYEQECSDAKEPADTKFLNDLRFHDLRHEATSRLAAVYQLHELTKVTGHKEPRMLMRYYHPDAEELAKRLS